MASVPMSSGGLDGKDGEWGRSKELSESQQQLFNVVGIPLLILSSVAIVFLLVQGRDILQPLFIAIFFSYLLRPLIAMLRTPYHRQRQHEDRVVREERVPQVAVVMPSPAASLHNPLPQTASSPDDEAGAAEYDDPDEAHGQQRQPLLHSPSSLVRRRTLPASSDPAMDPSSPDSGHIGEETRLQAVCGCYRLPYWMAVVVALVIVLAVIGGAVLMVADAIQSFEDDSLEVYEHQALKLRDQALDWVRLHFNVDGRYLVKQFSAGFSLSDVFKSLFYWLFDMVANLFFVLLFTLYLLFENTPRRKPAAHTTAARPSPDGSTQPVLRRAQTDESRGYSKDSLRGRIDVQIQHYITLKTMVSLLAASAVYIILGPGLDVRMANLFAVLTFLLNFIPNVGPIVATVLPLPVVLFDPRLGGMQMFLAFFLPGVVHMIVGNFLEPKLFGERLELHPIFLLLSLAFWYSIWGLVGAILAVPMTAVLKIIISYSQHPFARVTLHLMEGNINSLLADPRSSSVSAGM